MNIFSILGTLRERVTDEINHVRFHLADFIDPERLVPEHPHPVDTAHLAMALASIAREEHGDFQKTWNSAAPIMMDRNPWHFIDVSVALASMVAAVADEDDFAAFGRAVMHAEMELPR
jgi:hypothetical protein